MQPDPAVLYDRTFQAVDLLLANSAEMQASDLAQGRHKQLWLAYLKEFCTVKVGGPRRSGHSTVVNELVKRFDDRVIVFTHKLDMARHIKATHVVSPKSLSRIRGVPDIVAIIVDVATLFSDSEMREVYMAASCYRSKPFFVILMG